MYLYYHPLISTKSHSLASSQSAKSSPPQERPWEEKTILCYCDRRRENMADTIRAEYSPRRGMEREHQFVGNLVSLSYLQLSLFCSVVEPHSRITISLFVEMTMRKDILVGRQEIVCEPQHGSSLKNSYPCVWLSILHIEINISFCSDNGHSMEAITLFLTITESANRNSPLNAVVSTPSPTIADVDNPAAEGGAARLAVQLNSETVQSMTPPTSLPRLSRTGDPPIESDIPPVQPVAGSQAETSRTALRRAEEAVTNINMIKTWKSAVTNIKWVMDTVTPIAAVCPLLFFGPSTAEPITAF
jgi:hypothetical protein